MICCQYVARIDNKKPQHLVYKDIAVSVGGPTWARTRDQLIMSQLLAAKAYRAAPL